MADKYAGGPVAIKLPVPLDPVTLDVWAGQLERQAFTPLLTGLNQVIRYLNGDTTPPPVVIPPLVVIAAPALGAVLVGSTTITVRAAAANRIVLVSAYLGSTKVGDLGPTSGNGWVIGGIDTTQYPDGTYNLTVYVTDSVGNTSSDQVVIIVSNSSLPPAADVITSEAGDQITTEAGDVITLESAVATADNSILTEAGDVITTESADSIVYE